MEMLIVEFLVGVLAGTGSGLLIVRRSGRVTLSVKTGGIAETIPSKSRVASRQITKVRSVKHRRLHRGQARRTRPSNPIPGASQNGPQSAMTVLSCPTCGLQAPEGLMTEHFLGSPSHKDKPVEPVLEPASPEENGATAASDVDSRDSLRSLLQMLVPPRAFGRRHGQRIVDPLANIVQTIEGSRNTPVP